MADLADILPDFDLKPWRHLTFSLEKKGILTVELIALDPLELVKKCPLPQREVQRLISAITTALHRNLGCSSADRAKSLRGEDGVEERSTKKQRVDKPLPPKLHFVSTLDSRIDAVLDGGFPVGKITEIVGER